MIDAPKFRAFFIVYLHAQKKAPEKKKATRLKTRLSLPLISLPKSQ
jgi:hypothetical protein